MAAIGNVFAQGYGQGKQMGEDFARTKFNRGAAKVQQEYAERAKQEGKALADYLPEMESQLEDLYVTSGAAKRGVTDGRGGALSTSAISRLHDSIARGADRDAGALAASGNIAGAHQARADMAYRLGRFEDGLKGSMASDQIAATTSAIRPDGSYNMAAGADAMAKAAAKWGDADKAAKHTQQAQSFRMQAAAAKAGALLPMLQNLDKFSDDQIRGTFAGIKENIPEMQHLDIQKSGNQLMLYTNGQASGSLTSDEAIGMLSQFTQDPTTAVQGYMKSRVDAIQAEKTREDKIASQYRDAKFDAIKSLKDDGVPASVANSLAQAVSSLGKGGSGGGLKLTDVSDGGQYIIQKNGKPYMVKVGGEVDPKTGFGSSLQVTDMDGRPVPGKVFDQDESTNVISSLSKLSSDLSATNYKLKAGILKDKLGILQDMEDQELGRGKRRPRSERNNNPGNIEDRGQFKGNPDYLGSDGRFAKFRTAAAGEKAHVNQLERYYDGKVKAAGNRKLQTVNDIVNTWSPQSDPTNAAGSTRNYAKYVADRMGVDPDAKLSRDQLSGVAKAMAEFESGKTKKGALGSDKVAKSTTKQDNKRRAQWGDAADFFSRLA